VLTHVGLAILYGCIAAAFVEGLLRVWRVSAPTHRLVLRAVALVVPFALPALFAFAAPFRADDAFATRWALFAGAHWETLSLGGMGVASFATLVFAATGVSFFLRDFVPFVADRIRADRRDTLLPSSHPAHARFRAITHRASAVVSALPPGEWEPPASAAPRRIGVALRLIAAAEPVLYCSGIARPLITVSLGTMDRLDDDELAAAVAHELAHVQWKDPALGWLLMAVRALQAFNPATQVVARQIVQEFENRADCMVATSGRGAALARAIAKVSSADPVRSDLAEASAPALLASLVHRAVSHALVVRCERLLAREDTRPSGLGAWHLALAAIGLGIVLFFVV
jgi:Zn-dependent protease with chaperone function